MRRRHKVRSIKGNSSENKLRVRHPTAKPELILKARKGMGYDRLVEKREFRKELDREE